MVGPSDGVLWAGDRHLVVKRLRGPIERIDRATGETVLVLQGTEFVSCFASSPRGDLLASRDPDRLAIWDMAGKGLLRMRRANQPEPTAAAFSPDGAVLAIGDDRGVIRLWEVGTLEPRGTPLVGHSRAVRGLAFSPDARTLLSSSGDATLRLWDVAVSEELVSLREHGVSPALPQFTPDGRTLGYCWYDGTSSRLCLVTTALPAGVESEGVP
jgi:WD40 repeat protein